MSEFSGRTPFEDLMDSKPRRVLSSSKPLAGSLGALLAEKPKKSTIDHSSLSNRENTGNADISPPKGEVKIADNLMQAKIEHLERERLELGRKIQEKEEKERSSRIKIKLLESEVSEMEDAKSEQNLQLDILKKEKDSLLKQIGELNNRTMSDPNMSITSIHSGEDMIEESTATTLAKQLSNPPTYLSAHDPATQGLWSKMTAASRELRRMEEESLQLQQEKLSIENDCKARLAKQQAEVEKIQKKMEEDSKTMIVLSSAASETETLKEEIESLKGSKSTLESQLNENKNQNEQSIEEVNRLQEQINVHEDEYAKTKREVEYLENELKDVLEREARAVEEARVYATKAKIADEARSEDDKISQFIEAGGDSALITLIEDLKRRLGESEAKRRKLHGELQDLRGNIRVLVRARPFMRNDGENTEPCMVANKDNTSITLQVANKQPNIFHFDHVFGMETPQEKVYNEVTDLIQSALDGYRVCIFSYGQTGSGKTWTMSGERIGSNRGIIPRAVEQIIEQTLSMKEQGWKMTVGVSVLELYNEDLKDLLPTSQAAKDAKLKISNQQGRVHVAGLNTVEIDTVTTSSGMRQLEQLLEQSGRNRTTVATNMNERSSRSHMIFMMELTGVHADGTTVTHGALRLVDLAGSERLDRTGTANDAARLKETVNINKSLSCLADVFVNLGNKSSHIPYRNSKLTMLLQDCLGGDGKSLMIVNISPTQASANETTCSLRFADQVSQVELGKAVKQMYTTVPNSKAAPASSTTRRSTASNANDMETIEETASRKRTSSNSAALNTSTDEVGGKRTRTGARGGRMNF